jgi:hypothetical protein
MLTPSIPKLCHDPLTLCAETNDSSSTILWILGTYDETETNEALDENACRGLGDSEASGYLPDRGSALGEYE